MNNNCITVCSSILETLSISAFCDANWFSYCLSPFKRVFGHGLHNVCVCVCVCVCECVWSFLFFWFLTAKVPQESILLAILFHPHLYHLNSHYFQMNTNLFSELQVCLTMSQNHLICNLSKNGVMMIPLSKCGHHSLS